MAWHGLKQKFNFGHANFVERFSYDNFSTLYETQVWCDKYYVWIGFFN